LNEAGWECHAAAAYRTVVDHASVEGGREALSSGVDAVVFTSGSTVRSFVELWGKPPDGCVVCCIGPQTAEVSAELGVPVDAVAQEASVEGLVAALVARMRR
jgi:uroporphyrinogen III methyltransferase/synthase